MARKKFIGVENQRESLLKGPLTALNPKTAQLGILEWRSEDMSQSFGICLQPESRNTEQFFEDFHSQFGP